MPTQIAGSLSVYVPPGLLLWFMAIAGSIAVAVHLNWQLKVSVARLITATLILAVVTVIVTQLTGGIRIAWS